MKFNLEKEVIRIHNEIKTGIFDIDINADSKRIRNRLKKLIANYNSTEREKVLKDLSNYNSGKKISKKFPLEPEQYVEIYELGLFAKNSFENIAAKLMISPRYAKKVLSDFNHTLAWKIQKVLSNHLKNDRLAVLKDRARQYYDRNEHIPLTDAISVKKLFDLFPSKKLRAHSVELFKFGEERIFAVVLNCALDHLWLFIEDSSGKGLKIGGIDTRLKLCSPVDLIVLFGKQFFYCDQSEPWIKERICFQCHDHNCSPPRLHNNHVHHTVEQFDEMCKNFCEVLKQKNKQLKTKYIVDMGGASAGIKEIYYKRSLEEDRLTSKHPLTSYWLGAKDVHDGLNLNEKYMLFDFLQLPYFHHETMGAN
ncbi:MAG: hypothetical protein Q8Q33_04875 [Chlamydiota bacterium]|nr:hypothetical protein [Chlamydiota bacterium]